MAKTANAILADIRRTLNEPSALKFTDTEIDNWIDMGARRISAITKCYETQVSVSLINAGTGATFAYTLSDVIDVRAAIYDKGHLATYTNEGLQRANIKWWGHGAGVPASGPPKYYYFFGEKIFFWPTPSTSEHEDVVTVFCYKTVANYASDPADANTNTLPDALCEIVKPYVLSYANMRLGRHTLSGMYMRDFMERCSFYRQDVYDRMQTPDSYDLQQITDRTIPASQLQQ